MIFISLLILSAVAIAGSAAFFSVYGLAYTFSGTFWSVVVMGGSLEAGKLIAASYLYRYWAKTNWLLKTYLFAGVAALMIMTSVGIFGYLSSGYQTDVLPLKQLETQISILEDEKTRKLDRKREIDKQISQLPTNAVRGRERLIKQFKDEQNEVTARANAIDKEIIALKTQQIKTEAHIGPITYIAKAFELDTDNATKYLIYLIIFAFDPMAVALTLAVNIALRVRREEQNEKNNKEQSVDTAMNEFAKNLIQEQVPNNTGLSTSDLWELYDQKHKSADINTGSDVQPFTGPQPTGVSDSGVIDDRLAANPDQRDETIRQLKEELEQLQTKKVLSQEEIVTMDQIQRFFNRLALKEKVRNGTL